MGLMSPCDCLDITVCCGAVTLLGITNLSLHLATCDTTASHMSGCVGRMSSRFLNPDINVFHLHMVQFWEYGAERILGGI